MGNNQVGEYVSEEERNKIVERELRKKLTKQMKKLEDLDSKFYLIDWYKSQYKKGGYGEHLYYSNANDSYSSMTEIFLVRALYHWYSNIKI
tara:strand:+ start:413 stop:685 length:273 start_codon:yes stop_codon:yes gene_type:complete